MEHANSISLHLPDILLRALATCSPTLYQLPKCQPMVVFLIVSLVQTVKKLSIAPLPEPVGHERTGVILHEHSFWKPHSGVTRGRKHGLSVQCPIPGLWFSSGYTPKGSPPDMEAVKTEKEFSGGQESQPGTWELSHHWHVQHSCHNNLLKVINPLLFKWQVMETVCFCFQ
jgi:hypothetical protein